MVSLVVSQKRTEINVAGAKVLLGHGTQTKLPRERLCEKNVFATAKLLVKFRVNNQTAVTFELFCLNYKFNKIPYAFFFHGVEHFVRFVMCCTVHCTE